MSATDLDRIVTALDGKKEGSSWRCRCPVHDGHSLIVTIKDDTLLVHCHNGCQQNDVITALRERDLWPNEEPERPTNGQPVAEYQYADTGGTVIAVKGRFRKPNGEKSFAWRRPGDDGWKGLKGLKEHALPLYGIHLLPTDDGLVFVLEGEKAANACLDAGLLAVCPPGGAAAKTFGEQLKPLAGRDVVLWPDADPEGRALMQRISLLLQGVAGSVRTIAPEVPPKGDAYDYFQNGGTRDDLLRDLALLRTSPWVEETDTGYRAGVPIMGGAAMFEFSDLEERRHVLDAELVVWAEIPGMSREPFSGRINLLSLSQRDTFRRQLEDVVPLGKGGWTVLLNRACEMVRQAHAEHDPSIDLATPLPDTDAVPAYLAQPLVPSDGPSILFGKGGAGKSYMALLLASCIATGRDLLGRPARQGAVLFVDYESTRKRGRARVEAVLAGWGMCWDDLPSTIHYWPGHGRPLSDMVPALKRKVRGTNVQLIIIDSAALACAGKPEEADVALRYFNSLASLEIPSLTIAHLTKAEEDEYPFGSVFWHNSARMTWNLKGNEEDGRNVTHIGLCNRKANEKRKHQPIGVRMEFTAGAATFNREELRAGTDDRANVGRRIRTALRPGSQSVRALAEELDVDAAMVRARLNQLPDTRRLGKAQDGTGLWGLIANE